MRIGNVEIPSRLALAPMAESQTQRFAKSVLKWARV